MRHVTLRTKTGCKTCRIRKIKCDEAKPSCRRCTDTGRRCDGYEHVREAQQQKRLSSSGVVKSQHKASGSLRQSLSGPASILQSPKIGDNLNGEERRALSFYQECTAPKTTEIIRDDFWGAVVLQFSLIEPAIRHGLLALSALHEDSLLSRSKSRRSKSDNFAFGQYNLAIVGTKNLVGRAKSATDSVEKLKVLIACAVLTCYDNFVGNYQRAQTHLQSAVKLLRCEKSASANSNLPALFHPARRSIELTAVENMLFQLDFQAMTFSDVSAPYPYLASQGYENEEPRQNFTDPLSVSEALSSIILILRSGFQLSVQAVATNISAFDLQVQSDQLKAHLRYWTTFFGTLLNARSTESYGPRENVEAITLLHIYHQTATIILTSAFSPAETAWDVHTAAFSSILELAESFISEPSARLVAKNSTTTLSASIAAPSPSQPFTFNIGIIVPLFFLAFRCRHPHLRRRAVELLSREDRREGVWSSRAAAEVVKVIIGTEEEGLVGVSTEGDVPEGNRAKSIMTRVVLDEEGGGKVWLRVLRQPGGVGGEWKGKEYWVWI